MKFIDSKIEPEKGMSYATIKYKGEYFTGEAKCHPDDKFSNYSGCRFAEMRAEIKALKKEWKNKKAKCEECRKFVVAVSQYANFDKESKTAKVMFRQLNRRIKEVNDLAEEITRLQIVLNTAIRQKNSIDFRIKQKQLNDNQ